jgi:phage shock protein PspC (stress-responsive transcriptional regulator)
MSLNRSHEHLIRELGEGLTPVRRVVSPTWFVLAWLAVAGVIAAGLAMAYDMHAMVVRLTSASDMWRPGRR